MLGFATHPNDPLTPIRVAMAGFLAAALGAVLWSPSLFWLLLIAVVVLGTLFLAFRHTTAFTVLWLVIAGASLEMTIGDLLGPEAFQPTIAAVKAVGFLLAALMALRCGANADMLNPAFAWITMFLAGWAHGLYPGLSTAESVRSLIGSVAPFAFSFVRVSRNWAEAVIRVTGWIPSITVAAGAVLAAAGIRPLFIESAGVRLAGLGHPAFLAGVTQTAVYACLIALYRNGRHRDFLLLGTNFLILLLTGARAPLSYALGVTGLSLVLVRAPAFPARQRLVLILAAATALPLALLIVGASGIDISAIRAFNILSVGVDNLSGRQFLWPDFEQAFAGSPWLGWGVGAGNNIIPAGGEVAMLLHTRAAHNEYLRVGAEGGALGRALLILLFLLWVYRHTARLHCVDRVVMRLVFVAFAAHAATDNLLISTPACVLFTFTAAVFARGEWDGDGAASSSEARPGRT